MHVHVQEVCTAESVVFCRKYSIVDVERKIVCDVTSPVISNPDSHNCERFMMQVYNCHPVCTLTHTVELLYILDVVETENSSVAI